VLNMQTLPAALALMLITARPVPATSGKPINVLLITVDTLRADHLSSYGYPVITSPYIDGLAAEGARFSRSYTTIPLTGPSHLSILTGRYPQELGVLRNGVSPSSKAAMTPLPEVLKEHGYARAAFISGWPLTSHLTHLDRWFDHFDEELGRRYQLFNSSRYAEDVNPRVLKWMRAHGKGKEPFFLWVHYFDPHSPYLNRPHFQPKHRPDGAQTVSAADHETAERIQDYDSEIYYTDHYIGQVLDELSHLGLKDSTLVVFTADHGESLGEHGYVGHGRHLYESIVQTPLIMRLPGRIPAGSVIHAPVSSVDLTPTVLETVLGKWSKSGNPANLFSGRSLAASLEGKADPPPRSVYFVTFAGKKGSMPTWLSWVWVQDSELPLAFGYTKGTTKIVWRPEDKEMRLEEISRHETNPQRFTPTADRYKAEAAALSRWFEATQRRAEEANLSARDREILKGLGYIQ
jgi:arylsulfatase A-like enzyme